MTSILDDYALNSPLREKNNWLKIAITVFGIVVGVSSNSPVTPFIIALCMSIATIRFSKVPLSLYLKILAAPAGFVLVSVVIIAFFSGNGSEIFGFDLWDHRFGVSTGGLNMAWWCLHVLSVVCPAFFPFASTPMMELFFVLKATRFGFLHRDSHDDVSLYLCLLWKWYGYQVRPDGKTGIQGFQDLVQVNGHDGYISIYKGMGTGGEALCFHELKVL